MTHGQLILNECGIDLLIYKEIYFVNLALRGGRGTGRRDNCGS